jgi:hypothetical protein
MRQVYLISAILLAMGWAGMSWQKDSNEHVIPVLELQPPAPEGASPSRKQEGGPIQRRAFEVSRLADPATGLIPPDIHHREMEFAAQLPSWSRSGGLDSQDAAEKLTGWSYRGPWNIGGRTRALAIDVSDANLRTLLAGGISGGMWRTIDDGANWRLTTGSSQLHSVTTVAQDVRPGHQNVWYYGTGEVRGNSAGASGAPFRGDGVFKSVDEGVTWELLSATSGSEPEVYSSSWQYIWRVAVDPSEHVLDEVYVASRGFIFRSVDGGENFTSVLGDDSFWSVYTDVIVDSQGVVYATMSSPGGVPGIFRSPDGIAWTNITPAGLSTHGRIVLGLAPSNENIMYALAADINGTSNEGFYKYNYLGGDGSGAGGLWQDRSAQMADLPGPGTTADMETYGGYCQMVTVHPANPETVYIGGIHILRSYDGFATSNSVSRIGGWQYTEHHADNHVMLFKPGSETVVYTGSDGGVHKCSAINATTPSWLSLNNGYNTSQFYSVAIDENLPGSDIIVGGMQDNGSWFTNEVSPSSAWVEALGGDGSYCAVAEADGSLGTYYFSFQNGYVYRMTLDNFSGNYVNWTRVDPLGGDSYQFINPFILDPADTRIMYIASNMGIWRNSDLTAIPEFSNDPTSINWDHLTNVPFGYFITAMAASNSNNRILYYGDSQGHCYRLDNANIASPGVSPIALHTGAGFPPGSISGLGIHPADDQQVLLSFSNYNIASLFFTDDGGATWENVEGNLAGEFGPSVRSVSILPFGTAGVLYLAATSTGLYSTLELDGAATQWFLEGSQSMGNVVVDMIKIRPSDGLVVAGTHGKGVYSINVSASSPAGDLPASGGVVLSQNVPNPFNPRTVISFSLPSDALVSLEVYDIGGRLVKTLLQGNVSAGQHDAHWDGTDDRGRAVSTGMYLYRLRSGVVDEVRRMTLMR